MKPPPSAAFFAQLRADLFVIALVTMFIQAAVFVAIVVLRVPEMSFATPEFRLGVVGIAIATVFAVRWIERRATLDAIKADSLW
ncbi:hypothetical protein [Paraburkholderia sacchari]|uniref:hypothetical protein n=1 Tax=Paraburkholderia sacchari TaxID=159450 RepID=UPI001BD09719|nr:hypothetical protein [Paraburkholderia sacchari]